jgi:hypothetical protein
MRPSQNSETPKLRCAPGARTPMRRIGLCVQCQPQLTNEGQPNESQVVGTHQEASTSGRRCGNTSGTMECTKGPACCAQVQGSRRSVHRTQKQTEFSRRMVVSAVAHGIWTAFAHHRGAVLAQQGVWILVSERTRHHQPKQARGHEAGTAIQSHAPKHSEQGAQIPVVKMP